MTTPREIRFLQELIEHEKVFVRDLRRPVGALNPAQIAFSLRKRGWDILTGFVNMLDRDGKACRPGYYQLEGKEKERARQYLESIRGTCGSVPLTGDDVKLSTAQRSSDQDDSRRGEI